ncbi:MAG: glycosyl hydrolase, partial [Cyclobacteriaceae bacterium]|nr:glycosyl hydrolase [Cyclobacteriaceae bacterium]
MTRSHLQILLICVLSLQTGCQFERADKQRSMVEVAWPETSRESKPWTRWWWMGSAVDNESLTKNIENYHQSGLGGVEITPIYGVRGMEDRFIDYLSPRWMEALTHTTEEAARLDMGVDMATGTGWPFGGPHIQTKYAAGKLMVETFPLKTGERLKNRIESKNERFGKEAELIALMAYSDTGKIIDLTGQVVTEKTLNWIAPDGDWILYAMFSGQTGQRVKRAAPGGEGLVMDHMSAAALSHYLSRFDTAFASHENAQVRAFFNDSYEVYGADWSDTFLADFEKRRGYDLRTYFRELTTVEDDDASVRIKADYRETYSDLLLENFTNKWTNWAHIKGAVSRNQAHGSPGNLLDLYGAVDIPETEIFGPSHFNIPDLKTDTAFNNTRNDPLMLRFASSAAHVMGKKLTSSETGTWLGEHFSVALHQIKPEIDQLFTQGINHIFYHGTAYTPQDAPWPGWLFYASTNFGPSNAFWEDFESLNEYVTRCQSVLQSGNPGNDILLYWPVYDVWHNSGDMLQMLTVHNIHDWLQKSDFYHTAALLDKSGHTFDYVSDRQLMLAENSQGGIDLPGGKYKTIVIPKTEFMPLATLNKLRELAANGATIVFL